MFDEVGLNFSNLDLSWSNSNQGSLLYSTSTDITVSDQIINEEDINNLGPGTYNLLSIDAAGCETTHGPITINETPELFSDFNPFDSDSDFLFEKPL